jgi:hypothetical protein
MPVSLAVADLNKDGHLDFVTASQKDFTLTVYLGNGNGTFRRSADYPDKDTFLYSVTIADMNRDGNLDLLTCSHNAYAILLGNGDGTFRPRVAYSVADSSLSITCLADLNGDGKLDLIGRHWFYDRIAVMLGNGDGTVRPPVFYDVPGSPSAIKAADLNGDGKFDVATCNDDDSVSILLGNGDGTLRPQVAYAVGEDPSSLAFGNFNSDGYPDIVVSTAWARGVTVLINQGNGTFGNRSDYRVGDGSDLVHAVTTGDVNGDNCDDMVVAGEGKATVLINNAHAVFVTQSVAPVGSAELLVDDIPVLGDVNEDGKLDLLTMTGHSLVMDAGEVDAVSILMGNGDGTFLDLYAVGRWPNAIVAGRVDQGPTSDLITANNSDGTLSLLRGQGDGTFAAAATIQAGNSPRSPVLGRVDGDNSLDVVVGTWDTDGARLTSLLGHGDGTFFPPLRNLISSSALTLRLADVNGDGPADAIVLQYGQISVYFGHGDGRFDREKTTSLGRFRATHLEVGLFNEDSIPDVAVVEDGGDDRISGKIRIFLGSTTGAFTLQAEYGGGDYRYVIVGDLNLDGKADLVVADRSSRGVAVLLGNGDGTFRGPFLVDMGFPTCAAAIGDLNGDGNPDIVALSRTEGVTEHSENCVSVVLGSGNGSFGPFARYNVDFDPGSLCLALLNGDGSLDIATASGQQGTVSILLNNMILSIPVPNKPVGLTPAEGTTGVSVAPTLQASAYADPTSSPQSTSEFQVCSDAGLTLVVWTATRTSGDFTRVTLPAGTLALGTRYYWRVRYANERGWSQWSDARSFITNRPPNTPVGVAPANGATDQPLTPTLTASAFSDPDGDTQQSSWWQVASTSSFSIVVWNSGPLTAATSRSIPAGILQSGATYYWQVRYHDSQSAWSNWSDAFSFTTAIAPVASTTVLTVTPNPGIQGRPVTLQATVRAAVSNPAMPTGNVTFKDGGVILGTGTLDAMGVATYSTATLSLGSHTLTASYEGDIRFIASATAGLKERIVPPVTSSTKLTTSPNPSAFGETVALTATIRGSKGKTPTGIVTFLDGSIILGTAPLAGGLATYRTAGLTSGTHTIKASYAGDGTFGSSSATRTLTVKQAATVSFTSSPNPSAAGQWVTLTVTVRASVGTSIPTGSVTFLDGTKSLRKVNLSNGKAVFTTNKLTVGTHVLTAVYSGSKLFGASEVTLFQTVNAALASP